MNLQAPPQTRILAEIHIRLDDRDQPRLLADRREPRQSLRLCFQRMMCGEVGGVAEDRSAPFGEAGSGFSGSEQAGEEVVVPLGAGLGGGGGEGVRVGVGAEAGDDGSFCEDGS